MECQTKPPDHYKHQDDGRAGGVVAQQVAKISNNNKTQAPKYVNDAIIANQDRNEEGREKNEKGGITCN